jgi:hypothetical protein
MYDQIDETSSFGINVLLRCHSFRHKSFDAQFISHQQIKIINGVQNFNWNNRQRVKVAKNNDRMEKTQFATTANDGVLLEGSFDPFSYSFNLTKQ